MLHQNKSTPLYSSFEELYDIVVIASYAAQINSVFGPINDSWSYQMSFLSVVTGNHNSQC